MLTRRMFAQRHTLRPQLRWSSLHLFLKYFVGVSVSPKKNTRGIHQEQGGLGPSEIRVNVHSRMPSWQEKGKRFKDSRSRTLTKAFWALTLMLYPLIESLEPKCPGGTPYNGLYGETPPERGTFFRLQVYQMVEISLVEAWGREIWHLGLWKGPKGLTNEFYGFVKSRKRSIFVIDSYLKASAVKRGANF